MVIFEIIAQLVSLMLTVTSYAMALRMILPLFLDPQESRIYMFTCFLSEPVVAPVRAALSMFGYDDSMPIDIALPTTYLLIFLIQLFLPAI